MARTRPGADDPGDCGAVPTYPSERCFVVQLRSEADPARAAVSGRVEHLVSGRATAFDSLSALARFFSDVLDGLEAPAARPDTPGSERA